jgi:hypothetical protein
MTDKRSTGLKGFRKYFATPCSRHFTWVSELSKPDKTRRGIFP